MAATDFFSINLQAGVLCRRKGDQDELPLGFQRIVSLT